MLTWRHGASAFAFGVSLVAVAVAQGQEGPIAAMFKADQQRDTTLSSSFVPAELPAAPAAAFPLRIYLSAGDLERAFDRPEFRPDAAIVPTNTDLQLIAAAPATQRVLVDRVKKQPDAMRELEQQIAALAETIKELRAAIKS